jgi:hypothetical protein
MARLFLALCMQKSLGEKHMNRGQVNTINGPKALLGAALCALVLSCPAWAQSGTEPAPTDTLAGYIAKQVGANGHYKLAKLGKDWCFNVERELGYNWWYYNADNAATGVKPSLVTNTVRIQGTYVDGDGFRKFASLFIGLDGMADKLPAFNRSLDSNAVVASSAKAYPTAAPARPMDPPDFGTSPENILDVPTSGSPSSNCQSMGQFLMAYALPYTPTMKYVPSLQQVDWKKDNFSFNNHDYTQGRYWMFNGRAHQVVNIMSYSFGLTAESGTPYPEVKLVVGIGGGAGP